MITACTEGADEPGCCAYSQSAPQRIESMNGTRIEQGPGEFSFGEDQGCTKDAQGRKGHKSGTLGNEPAVLMTVQLHTEPQQVPCHIK